MITRRDNSLPAKNDIRSRTGAVTFLDVLGWKGIWQKNEGSIDRLYGLIQEAINKSNEISHEYADFPEFRGVDNITNVLSISDTIALFTAGSPDKAIEIHAKICSWLIPYALKQELPLRGAISYGNYSIKENIMLGYAVDEAASWHETTNWIGVVLSPSAQIRCRSHIPASITTYHDIPFKHSEKNLIYCVDWKFEDADSLDEIIEKKGPHTPEIASKYLNTLAFISRDSQ